MSIGSDSRVVDALQDARNLEALLRALRCETHSEGGPFGHSQAHIHCPNPDHPDKHPSCSVIVDGGFFECRSRCDTIRPMDLVVAHGYASDRAEAAKWIERALGLQPELRTGPPPTIVRNPALTVSQYLTLKHLSAETVQRFDLRDVRVWEDGERTRKGYDLQFESSYYGAVLMPNDAPGSDPQHFAYRPRVRNVFGARWPAKVQFATVDTRGGSGRIIETIQFSKGGATADELGHVQRSYGYPQLAPMPDGSLLSRILFAYEGESDVHASHDLGVTACLGLPGVGAFRSNVGDLLDAIERLEPGVDPALWTIAVWQEPGDAGASLPGKVAGAVAAYCTENFMNAPRVAALPHTALAAIPTSTLPGASAEHAKDPCELVGRLVPLHRGDAAAARVQAAQIFADGAFVALGQTATQLDPVAPPAAVTPSRAELPPVAALTRPASDLDPWIDMDTDGELAPPDSGDCPAKLEHLGHTFMRTPDGWAWSTVDKDGEPKTVAVSTIFFVREVQDVGGEDHVVLTAPRRHSLSFQDVRVPRADLTDGRKISGALAGIGCTPALRMGAHAGAIASALAERWLSRHEIVRLPAATGWSGRAGTGPFGGYDCEPLNAFGAIMFEANKARRAAAATADLDGYRAQASEWWERGALPIIQAVRGADGELREDACLAAPLLAIGAAAAAPLIGPLGDVGVNVSPVLWIAGLGGGGKSVTQKLVASIFAPVTANLDGQIAFCANANISMAALGARVDSCRDLPLELDDVTQLPPMHGTTSRGDDARLEAAAQLGMFIFNRKPIERANRDGGSRLTRAFRSSAIFSAEISMSSETSKAVITAGHRRRISCIEAKPMSDRGLGQPYAEAVNHLAATVGGAPGELLIDYIRTCVKQNRLRGMYDQVRNGIAALPQAEGVTNTQIETLAMTVLGFCMVAHTSGAWDFDQALEHSKWTLSPYLEAGAGEGGATRDDELASSERILHAVEEMLQSQPQRWDWPYGSGVQQTVPGQGFLGKVLRSYAGEDSRRVILFTEGMMLLKGRYGVTQQMIAQAVADGHIQQGHQYRDDERKLKRGTMVRLPAEELAEDDPDAPRGAEHEHDPFGLARTMFTKNEVHEAPRVPGMGVAMAQDAPEEHEQDVSVMLLQQTGVTWEAPEYLTPDKYEEFCLQRTLAYYADIVRSQGRQAAAKWVFESVTSAMMLAYEHGNATRTIYYMEGSSVKGMRFIWGKGGGFYAVSNAAAVLADDKARENLYAKIREDVGNELKALREFYIKAAESDPKGALGEPVPVLDLPELGDPNLEQISALGWEVARKQWDDHWDAVWAANHNPDPATQRAYHELHVKHVRVHLMARLQHPEWFIVDEASLAPAA